uniref:Uncharacterized protein n=1 Tax=Wuchereria bancrofti TaxID=6293 RepID=A0A1I8EY67_WUCBA
MNSFFSDATSSVVATKNLDKTNSTTTSTKNKAKNNAYSITKLLEKKEPSSSRASSSSASDDDNGAIGRCHSTDDDGSRYTDLAELGRAVTWPHFFAAGPSAFTIPHAANSLIDSNSFANAIAAAAVGADGQDLSQVQQIQNAYLSYILGTSMTAAAPVIPHHHPLHIMVAPSDTDERKKRKCEGELNDDGIVEGMTADCLYVYDAENAGNAKKSLRYTTGKRGKF